MNKIKRIMAVMLALVMVLAIAPMQHIWADGGAARESTAG